MNSHWYEDKLFVNSFLKTILKTLLVMKPMVLSASWADSLEIIALQTVLEIARD